MPLKNLFKNCAYYWLFAIFVSYNLTSTSYVNVTPSFYKVMIGLAIFMRSEQLNLKYHFMLSNLRSDKNSLSSRPIPRGFAFEYVTCPNYLYEFTSWLGYSLMTGLTSSYVFTIIGFIQMYLWARKKHNRYLQMYPDKYKKLGRKVILPYIL